MVDPGSIENRCRTDVVVSSIRIIIICWTKSVIMFAFIFINKIKFLKMRHLCI